MNNFIMVFLPGSRKKPDGLAECFNMIIDIKNKRFTRVSYTLHCIYKVHAQIATIFDCVFDFYVHCCYIVVFIPLKTKIYGGLLASQRVCKTSHPIRRTPLTITRLTYRTNLIKTQCCSVGIV